MRYGVDPRGLDELAAGLRGVAATMGGLARLGGAGLDVGSASVARALDEVGHGWSHARRRIEGELTALSRAADLASRTYAWADGGVAEACRR